jgi:hypothetical protein
LVNIYSPFEKCQCFATSLKPRRELHMPGPKIAFIGAGSVVFAKNLLEGPRPKG